MKRYINLALVLILCLSLLSVTAFAAGESASLTGPGSVRAGDTITVTLNVTGNGIYGASGVLSYDSNQMTLVSTQTVIGAAWMVEFNGNNFVAYDNNLSTPIRGTAALFTLTFKVGDVKPGTTVAVSCDNLVVSDGAVDAKIGTVTYSATIAAPMSTDNTLKSLTVSNATISPAFSAGTTKYTAEVPFDVSKLDVKAEANNSKAKVSVNSPKLTPNGTTNVTITVTAENGSTKTYTISVKRAQDPNYVASSNNNLAGITVNGFLLSPEFSADNTSYVIWLPYETENITVSGTAADSKASVSVEGGSDLEAGADNEIKVICTAEDGTQKVYTVIAKRAAAHDDSAEPTEPSVTPTEPSTEPTEPSVAPTEPSTEPSTPSTQPSNPAPTEPQEPADTEKTGGIPWWVLLIVGIVCLACGTVVGIIVGKKPQKK